VNVGWLVGWVCCACLHTHTHTHTHTHQDQLAYAIKVKPEFLVVCQWNEFAGTPESASKSYADSYNVSLSNDIEPTSLTDCGYARPNDRPCGGWGFRPLNLLSAMMTQLRSPSDSTNLITLVSPLPLSTYSQQSPVVVQWATYGSVGSGFSVAVDGQVVARAPQSPVSFIPSDHGISAGSHVVTVTCSDCTTTRGVSASSWQSTDSSPRPAVGSARFHVAS